MICKYITDNLKSTQLILNLNKPIHFNIVLISFKIFQNIYELAKLNNIFTLVLDIKYKKKKLIIMFYILKIINFQKNIYGKL
jgi:hypothetical protein